MTKSALVVAFVALAACLGLVAPSRAADAQPPASPRRVGVLLALLGRVNKLLLQLASDPVASRDG